MARVNRWYWKCRDCLTAVAVDVEVNERCTVWSETAQTHRAMECGACGGAMWLMGRVQGGHCVHDGKACACDSRCTGAAGPNCDCQCGGVNHGTGATVDVVHVTGSVPVARVVPLPKLLAQVAEYRAARQEIADMLAEYPAGWLPEDKYRRKEALRWAYHHAGKLSSHSGRMKCLREVLGADWRAPQAAQVEPVAEFALARPAAGKPAPARFCNNTLADGSKRAQKVLFTGLDCLAGQQDLFG